MARPATYRTLWTLAWRGSSRFPVRQAVYNGRPSSRSNANFPQWFRASRQYARLMERYWLLTIEEQLVEVNSGTTIEVLGQADEAHRVVLRIGAGEHELYRGREARAYLAGLARVFGAAAAEGLIAYGRGKVD